MFEIAEVFVLEYIFNIEIKNENKAEIGIATCLSPIWLTSSSFEFFIVLVFICFVIKLDNKMNKHMEIQIMKYGFNDDHFKS